jgi:NAD(P)-dependent dehydrogenase (short-subunit alcohol dehydrogenase family)
LDLGLEGKLALVSGSTAGIGYAIAEQLVREGARVIVNGRTQNSVDAAVAKLNAIATGRALGFAADLSTAAGANDVAKKYRDVDIVVNNLGIFEPREFIDIDDEEWLRFFEVNVLSGIRLARLYLPSMKKQNWGRIIFISSESGVQIPPEMIHYGVTKTAQLAVSRGLAESLAGTGITVNCVLPGPTRSRGVEDFVDALAKREGKTFQQFETEFFQKVRADVAHQALRQAGGSGRDGGVRGESVVVRDDRRGPARRWRRCEERRLNIQSWGAHDLQSRVCSRLLFLRPCAAQQRNAFPQPTAAKEVTVMGIPGVIAAGAKWKLVWQGPDNADGIIGTKDGGLLFAQEQPSTVGMVDRNDKFSIFVRDTHGTGALAYDNKGRLIGAERTCSDPGGRPAECKEAAELVVLYPTRLVLASKFEDKTFWRMGEVVADSKVGAYFSDDAGTYFVNRGGK